VAEDVGVPAQARDVARQRLEGGTLADLLERPRVAVRHAGALEVGLARRVQALAGPAAAPAEDPLAERGEVEYADDRLAVLDQREDRPEQRDPAREADRAVERVDHPGRHLEHRPLGPELLAQDGEAGRARAQDLADRALGGAVGLGHRRAVGLALEGDAAKARQDLRPRAVAGLAGERDGALQLGGLHAGPG